LGSGGTGIGRCRSGGKLCRAAGSEEDEEEEEDDDDD
jgi:hypothetical protein